MTERVLVTGGTGFLGGVLTRMLVSQGADVTVFVRRKTPDLERLNVACVLGDIRDPDAVHRACRNQTVVHHTAAISGIWGRWSDFYEINTQGTRHVLEACLRNGVSRLVYTSSPSVTFAGQPQCGIDERAAYPTRWLCHYPHTKMLAERSVLAAHGQGDLLTCALRPHLIWGPGDHHLVPRLLQRARDGQLRRVGSGENLIDTVFVDNAAYAQVLAAESLKPGASCGGRAYFISQGAPVNCWRWIDELLTLAGIPRLRKSVSFQTAWRIGALLEGAHRLLRISAEPRMTRFLAAQLAQSHYFDISAARRDLGYRPLVSQEEGMRRLANSLQTQ